jgi:uncharacterized membrane protein
MAMRFGLTRPSRHRRRLLALAVVAIVVGVLLPADVQTAARVVISWDVGVAVYLLLVWGMMARATEHDIRVRALVEDESPSGVTALLVAAACASLLAIVVVISTSASLEPWTKKLHLGLAAATILLSWLLVQTVYAVHYAHSYYGDGADREIAAGLRFPNKEPPPLYADFAYFSFVVGMTCQVADVSITNSEMRRMVLIHGVISFFFNAIIIALSVNIAASFM